MRHGQLALFACAASAFLLAACQTIAQPAGPQASAQPNTAPDPPAFVEAVCGDCHGVEPRFLSPNPSAPTFAAIANTPGFRQDSVRMWLSDAHNYPDEMEFELEPHHVEQIADYMITLKDDDYRPVE